MAKVSADAVDEVERAVVVVVVGADAAEVSLDPGAWRQCSQTAS